MVLLTSFVAPQIWISYLSTDFVLVTAIVILTFDR